MNMKEINKKLSLGDHVTDEELLYAQKSYSDLIDALKAAENENYHLVFVNACQQLALVEQYLNSRKSKLTA